MSTLTWVLAGLAAYWLLVVFLRSTGRLPSSVRAVGPLLMLRTRRGRDFIDWVATPRRLWRAWGNFGLGVALVVMVGSLFALLAIAVEQVRNPPPETAVTQPQNALVIPGVNEFLPLSVAPEIVAGLAIGLVVHEGGHGILCRVEDIRIESLGLLLLAVLPVGAFVEPDQESQERADRGSRARMFAAGVTNNFAVTVVGFALLFGPLAGSFAVVQGAAVAGAVPGGPAADATGPGDVIVGVGEQTVAENDDLDPALAAAGREVSVRFRDGETATVQRSVFVSAAVDGGPLGFATGSTVTSVEGTPVHTLGEFYAALEGAGPVVTMTNASGTSVTGAVGASVTVQAGGPLADAGAPAEEALVITHFGGERVYNSSDVQSLLGETAPDQQVTVTARDGAGATTYTVTLGAHPVEETGYLGVFIAPGVSGLSVTDFGVELYPAGQYLSALGGECPECTGFDVGAVERSLLALTLPVAGVAGGILPFNFAGFTGYVTNFFVPTGLLAGLGGGAFLLFNLVFWTAWINLNLGIFNCVPTFMLDGGHMLRAAVESVVARLPVENGQQTVTATTVAVQVVMLASLLLLLFGPQLLR